MVNSPSPSWCNCHLREREAWYRAELKRQPEWEAFVKAGGVEWVRQKNQSGNKPGKEEK